MDARRHEAEAAGDLELDAALRVEVVEMAWVLDDQPAAGGECGPIRVDHIAAALDEGIDDEPERDGDHDHSPAPPPSGGRGLSLHVAFSSPSTRVTGVTRPPWTRSESRTTP